MWANWNLYTLENYLGILSKVKPHPPYHPDTSWKCAYVSKTTGKDTYSSMISNSRSKETNLMNKPQSKLQHSPVGST